MTLDPDYITELYQKDFECEECGYCGPASNIKVTDINVRFFLDEVEVDTNFICRQCDKQGSTWFLTTKEVLV